MDNNLLIEEMYQDFLKQTVNEFSVNLTKDEIKQATEGYVDENDGISTIGKIHLYRDLCKKYSRELLNEYHYWLFDNFDIKPKDKE